MPPKPTKVQPAGSARGGGRGGGRAGSTTRAGSTRGAGSKSNGQVTSLPPIAGATGKPGTQEPDQVLQHENDMYNEYDQDGHRIKSPEPTTRWGKFKKKFKSWWRNSALYRKKKEYQKWREERR